MEQPFFFELWIFQFNHSVSIHCFFSLCFAPCCMCMVCAFSVWLLLPTAVVKQHSQVASLKPIYSSAFWSLLYLFSFFVASLLLYLFLFHVEQSLFPNAFERIIWFGLHGRSAMLWPNNNKIETVRAVGSISGSCVCVCVSHLICNSIDHTHCQLIKFNCIMQCMVCAVKLHAAQDTGIFIFAINDDDDDGSRRRKCCLVLVLKFIKFIWLVSHKSSTVFAEKGNAHTHTVDMLWLTKCASEKQVNSPE